MRVGCFLGFLFSRELVVGVYVSLLLGCSAGLAQAPPVLIRGAIQYEGNRDYLPRTVGQDDSGMKIRFEYEVQQGREDSSTIFLPVVNLVINPKGMNWVIAAGSLEILEDGQVKHSYKSVKQLDGAGVGGATTLTALRRRALLAVRDDIERQMIQEGLPGNSTRGSE